MSDKLFKYRLCGCIPATITGKLLYLVLNEISDERGETTISQRKISEILQISKGAVRRNLHGLKRMGFIGITAQYNDYGGRAPNKYVLK
jgi:DNA-binding MarR family transcriptional regulator